jgi:hypothetical protein
MESFCVKQNNSPAASLLFDVSYVGSRVVGSYLFIVSFRHFLRYSVISSMHTDLVTHDTHEPSNHDQPHTTRTDKEMKKRTDVVKGINENDPNDMAFKLVTMFMYLLCCEYSFFCLLLSFFMKYESPPPLLS